MKKRTIKIGKTVLQGNLFLAPIAGYSDAAFRTICIRFGASLVFTEMISSEALTRGNKKTIDLLIRGEEETHWGIQLFSGNPTSLAKSVEIASKYNPTVIDLNCGCSVPKVLKTGAGAALLKNPEKLYRMIKLMKEATDIPISIKIRSGWDIDSLNYTEIGKLAEEAGVSMITLHPRTRAQGFSGKANWEHIKKLKESLSIPVIGSGDLFSADDINKMLTTTSCDGAMIARGAFGNPFIFREFDTQYVSPQTVPVFDFEEKLKTALEHLKLAVHFKGEKLACKDMRKHIVAYSKGMPDSASFRNRVIHAESFSEYDAIINKYIAVLKYRNKLNTM